MTLAKPFREALERHSAVKQAPLHQVLIAPKDGGADIEQAREYAGALIMRGVTHSTPVEINCKQPMSDDTWQRIFKDAKGCVLIVTHAESMVREETFVSLAIQAIDKKTLAGIILCGTKEGVTQILIDNQHLKNRLPSITDLGDRGVLDEIAAYEKLKKEDDLKVLTDVTVKNPVTPMAPLSFTPKKPGSL